MTAQNNHATQQLGFADAVAAHIAPVLADRGFRCVEATPSSISFESAEVIVAVSHEPFSFEIEVKFALKADPSQKYGLGELLDWQLGPEHKEERFFQASNPKRVVDCLITIAGLIRRHGQEVMTGQREAYRGMASAARARDAAYTKRVIEAPVRRAAEQAWEVRDFSKVCELYGSLEADLTSVEKTRLSYARSHC